MSRDVCADADGHRTRTSRLSWRNCRTGADGNRTRQSRVGNRDRAQSNVVGVAVLLGVVAVALGSLTAGIGAVVEENAAAADSARVAADFDSALEPVAATGVHRGRVSFTDGRLRTVERELRVLNETGVVRTVRVDALVFTAGDRRVAFLAGGVVRGPSGNARMRTAPPVTASRGGGGASGDEPGVLVVGAPKLNGSVAVSATGGGSVVLRTTVGHRRVALGNGTYRVAVETATPDAWRRRFERRNATATTRDFDGDGVVSVVGAYPGERVAYLVVHDMRLEVRRG